jgi:hypothetical protein
MKLEVLALGVAVLLVGSAAGIDHGFMEQFGDDPRFQTVLEHRQACILKWLWKYFLKSD